MARDKERLSREEREAHKRKQEELKKVAIRHKSRQLNAVFRIVAVLGIILGLLVLLKSLYTSEEFPRSGYSAVKDIMMTGQAYVKTGSITDTFQMREAGILREVFALLPFLLGAFLIIYIVDFAAPLGRSPHVLAVIFAIGMSVFLTIMTRPELVNMETLWPGWPGVDGKVISHEILALLIFSLGAITATPGSKRRLAEYLGGETGVPAGGGLGDGVAPAAAGGVSVGGASEGAAETAAAAEGVSEAAETATSGAGASEAADRTGASAEDVGEAAGDAASAPGVSGAAQAATSADSVGETAETAASAPGASGTTQAATSAEGIAETAETAASGEGASEGAVETAAAAESVSEAAGGDSVEETTDTGGRGSGFEKPEEQQEEIG